MTSKRAEPLTEPYYTCDECGSANVQMSWPIWIHANDPNVPQELDHEAQPWKDSAKCWCLDCEDHAMLSVEHPDYTTPPPPG